MATPLTPKVQEYQVTPVAPGAAALTFVAADIINDNEFATLGREILIAHNTAVGAQTITIPTAADAWGREGAITTYEIAPDTFAVFGPFQTHVWRQSGNVVGDIVCSDAAIELAVIRVP